ncbi:yeats family-domain-containing protein [Paraphysoderma sedebokerense]|nr:yeats family-domain-containing protein [Paraphysoderma sedebokerense]
MQSSSQQEQRQRHQQPQQRNCPPTPPISPDKLVFPRSRSNAHTQTPQSQSQENIQDEHMCPFCLKLLYDPVSTPCNHSFCKLCIAQWYFKGHDVLLELNPHDIHSQDQPSCDSTTAQSDNNASTNCESRFNHLSISGNAAEGVERLIQQRHRLHDQSETGDERANSRRLNKREERGNVEKSCAICRRSVKWKDIRPNTELNQQVTHVYPAATAIRQNETQSDIRLLSLIKIHHRKLYIGNTHSYSLDSSSIPLSSSSWSSNVHLWTFFVRMDKEEEKYIERVVVKLHPTFSPSTVTLTRPPFQVRRLGWGYFTIRSEIYFQKSWRKDPLLVYWTLDFNGDGNVEEIDVEFVEEAPSPSVAAESVVSGEASSSSSQPLPLTTTTSTAESSPEILSSPTPTPASTPTPTPASSPSRTHFPHYTSQTSYSPRDRSNTDTRPRDRQVSFNSIYSDDNGGIVMVPVEEYSFDSHSQHSSDADDAQEFSNDNDQIQSPIHDEFFPHPRYPSHLHHGYGHPEHSEFASHSAHPFHWFHEGSSTQPDSEGDFGHGHGHGPGYPSEFANESFEGDESADGGHSRRYSFFEE